MRETRKLPLVVDLDGTLTVSDTLTESVIRVVKHKPANLLRLPFWLAGGRAAFKAKVAACADFRPETLPYRQPLVDYHTREHESGRKIVHQWLKNLLLFVPLLTAFAFLDADTVGTLALAFLSMSLGASATYIGNDLWDLDSDRRHPGKRNRPFASAVLSINHGIACAALLLTSAFSLALVVSAEFTGTLALYLFLTIAARRLARRWGFSRQRSADSLLSQANLR